MSAERPSDSVANAAPRIRIQSIVDCRNPSGRGRNVVSRSEIVKCLVCGYALRGLPASCSCPECGFRYDEGATVFYPGHRLSLFSGDRRAIAFYGAGLACISLSMQAWLMLGQRGYVVAAVVVMLSIPALVYLLARYAASVQHKRQYVAITPDYLVVKLGGRWQQKTPWTDISSVRRVPTDGSEPCQAAVFLKSQTSFEIGEFAALFPTEVQLRQFLEGCTAHIQQSADNVTPTATRQ